MCALQEALDPIVEDAQLEAAVAEQIAKAQANAGNRPVIRTVCPFALRPLCS